jgi:hypothetical protein
VNVLLFVGINFRGFLEFVVSNITGNKTIKNFINLITIEKCFILALQTIKGQNDYTGLMNKV